MIDVYKSHAHEKKVSFLLLNRFFILPLQKNLHISAKIYRYGKIYKPVLKHMEALNRLPWAAQSPIFKRLSEIAEISELSTEERIKYDAAIQWYRDNAFLLEGAEEVGLQKGMKKGLEKGRAEGRAEGLKETARNLKSMGLGVSDIQKATGLSEEEIRSL